MTSSFLYIGIKGHVVALDRTTGAERWRTKLKSSDFTNVVIDRGAIFATTMGEIFCLDANSGSILWHNNLKGLGMGLITIGSTGDQLSGMEKKRREQAAASAATTG